MNIVLLVLCFLSAIHQIYSQNSTTQSPNNNNTQNAPNTTQSTINTSQSTKNNTQILANTSQLISNTTQAQIIDNSTYAELNATMIHEEEVNASIIHEQEVKDLHTILPDGTVHHAFFNPAYRNWRIVPPEEDIDEDNLETRIVGGRNAKPGEHPFQVAVMLDDFGLWCGGIVYSSDTVLTAAHCFYERKTVRISDESFAYAFGKQDLRKLESVSEQLSSSSSVKLHPDYSPQTGYNDIAVVKLASKLCFDKYVQPIRISGRSQNHAGDASVSGWGYTLVKSAQHTEADEEAEDAYKRVLEETTVRIVSKQTCREFYANDLGSRGFAKHPSILCAGHEAGGKDACTGDSGGPLVCSDRKGQYLCGIVATGVGCGLANRPAFYSNVTYFYDWILEHAGPPGINCK